MKLRCYVTCLDGSPWWADMECPEGVSIEQAIELAESGQMNCSNYTIQHVSRVYLACRHPGAVEFAAQEGFDVTDIVPHIDDNLIENLHTGDRVLGIIPLDLAAKICEKGAEMYNLNMNLPFVARGKELTAQDMKSFGANFQQFVVKAV